MKTRADIPSVRRALDAGAPALLPTETVWGLAARADSADAVAAIYGLKQRDDGKPLAVCVADVAGAESLAELSDTARALAAAHWPGPLTLVVPVRADAGLHAKTRSGGTVGLRCPDVFWRVALCATPLALTSANISGEDPALSEDDARAAFPGVALLPDPDPAPPAAPTTVVRVTGERVEILRQGDLRLEVGA